MLDQVLSIFGIVPDYDLDIMQSNQGLTELTARLLVSLDKVLEKESPDIVLAQGDTTTVMTTSQKFESNTLTGRTLKEVLLACPSFFLSTVSGNWSQPFIILSV